MVAPERTLMFLVRDDQILLGRKKQQHESSFGVGKWNGFGGKLEPGETVAQAAIRECEEECGVTPTSFHQVALLNFVDDYQILGYVFLADEWIGEPHETDEMEPQWFNKHDLPWDQMWDDDIFWVPAVLSGKKVKADFVFTHSEDVLGNVPNPVKKVAIEVVDEF